jgi:hypothetical protein
MYRGVILLCLFISTTVCKGQQGFSGQGGSKSTGLGNARLTFKDIHSIYTNQAGLAFLQKAAANAFVQNRFLLSELTQATLGVASPTPFGAFGISLQYFGSSDYNEKKIGLAYSKKLMDNLAIGAQFSLLSTHISGYGNKTSLTVEMGLIYGITEQIEAGVHIFNPIRTAILDGTPIPSILQMGFTYVPADYLSFSLAIEKETLTPFNVKLGLEYVFSEKFSFLTGINTSPYSYSFGWGYHWKKYWVYVSGSTHPVLGFSPAIGITWIFEK